MGFDTVEIEIFKTKKKSSCSKTQSQLASDMGMDVRTLQNYKLLADMIPELSDLVDTGIVTKNINCNLWFKWSI